MKILRQISGATGIFFPIGLPPEGTCKFATKICLAKCIALKDKGNDNELRVSQHFKKSAHHFFITESTIKVCFKIIEEMAQSQASVLHWFMSGDCLPEDEMKMIDIVETLWKNTQIVQVGFTRNKRFWNSIRHISNIVLTCDPPTDGAFPDRDSYHRIFGVPNYDSDVVELYIVGKSKGATRYSGCGAVVVDYNYHGRRIKGERPVNCAQCLKLKQGCFYKQKIRRGKLK